MPIRITRTAERAEDLRRAARSTRNVGQARRLLAIALVMDGSSRADAATAAGMDRQSLRDWVHRFNAEGPAGLVDKPRSGRPARMTAEQSQALDAIVDAGPDMAAHPCQKCMSYGFRLIASPSPMSNSRPKSREAINRKPYHTPISPHDLGPWDARASQLRARSAKVMHERHSAGRTGEGSGRLGPVEVIMVDPAQERLATYGRLAPGRPNHHQVSDLAGTWRPGSVRGRLVQSGWGAAMGYPGLVLGPEGSEIGVRLFASNELPSKWARLDAFEGDGYRRAITTVMTEEGEVEACIYVLAT